MHSVLHFLFPGATATINSDYKKKLASLAVESVNICFTKCLGWCACCNSILNCTWFSTVLNFWCNRRKWLQLKRLMIFISFSGVGSLAVESVLLYLKHSSTGRSLLFQSFRERILANFQSVLIFYFFSRAASVGKD